MAKEKRYKVSVPMPENATAVHLYSQGKLVRVLKPKTHHKPFYVEVNGPATIVMHLDAVEHGVVLNLDLIREAAKKTVRYLQAIEKGDLPKWHELTSCPGCGTVEVGRDQNGLCDECNIKNKVAGD